MRSRLAVRLLLAVAASSPLHATSTGCSTAFPAFFVPFTSVDYVSAPDNAGDRLVVGTVGNLGAIGNLPAPSSVKQEFCGNVTLAANYTLSAYVPTAAERGGDFSAFAGLLLDPSNNQPYPGGVIPGSQLGTVFAWRIPPAVAPQNNVTYALSVDYSISLGAGATLNWQFSVPTILTSDTTISTFQSTSVGPAFSGCVISSAALPVPVSAPIVSGELTSYATPCTSRQVRTSGAGFFQALASPGVYNAYVPDNNVSVQIGTLTILQGAALTSLSPGSAAAGGGPFTLTVIGTGFVAGSVIQWNGTPLSTTFGNATQLTATVPANLTASAGTANVTVAAGAATIGSVPFTVNPPGQACTFLFPPTAGLGATGGPGGISVTASRSDCSWTPVSNASWIHVPGAPVTGSGNLNYSVDANTGATSRTGTFTIGARVFTVIQGGTTCTYSLPSASQAFGPGGGNGAAGIQAPPGCSWTATNPVPWISIAH